jgi:ATP-binding cassette subfamily C (CFTR/MRP) protein 1
VGYSFLPGVGVFIAAFFVNSCFGYCLVRKQKDVMARKDARMKQTKEALNNIKSLKINSWEDYFYNSIKDKRMLELSSLRVTGTIISFLVGCVYFFRNLLPAVVFTTYIGTGHVLDLPTAVTCLVLFNLMKRPLIQVPMFVTNILNLKVSMKRVQRFMKTDEV